MGGGTGTGIEYLDLPDKNLKLEGDYCVIEMLNGEYKSYNQGEVLSLLDEDDFEYKGSGVIEPNLSKEEAKKICEEYNKGLEKKVD